MDERTLNEFESVFEAAVKPSVELVPITWERILVALDGSERGASAISVAVDLARRVACPIHLLATRAILEGEEESQLREALDIQVQAARSEVEQAAVPVSASVELGAPGDVIVAELHASPTTLMVLPTPGSHNMDMGSGLRN